MTTNRLLSSLVIVAVTIVVLAAAPPLKAQGRGGAQAPIVIPPEGQTTGPVPRLPNGKPDFSGTFDHPRVTDITKPATGCVAGTPGCSSVSDTAEMPYTAFGREEDKKEKFDYGLHCLPWGYVRSFATPYPHGYIQNNDKLVVLWEQDNFFHVVPTDGRKLPQDLEPTWMGTSVGHWEGDTLVVETAGFNGKTWIDTGGEHTFTDQFRTVERMSLIDKDHLRVELTMSEPKMWTKPIKNTRVFSRMKPGSELLEYSCEENNKEVNEGFYLTDNPLKDKPQPTQK